MEEIHRYMYLTDKQHENFDDDAEDKSGFYEPPHDVLPDNKDGAKPTYMTLHDFYLVQNSLSHLV